MSRFIKLMYYAIVGGAFDNGNIDLHQVTNDGDGLFIFDHSLDMVFLNGDLDIYAESLSEDGYFDFDEGTIEYGDEIGFDYSTIHFSGIGEDVFKEFNPQFRNYLKKHGIKC